MLEEGASEVMKAIRHSWVRVITSLAERSLRKINYMKVTGTVLFLLCLAQSGYAAEKPAGPFKVLCSFYPMYVMALNVVGDTPGVEVECLTEPIVGCLHDYQLTPANLKTIGSADVLVANGAGMEAFINKAVEQSPQLKVIEASRGVKLEFNDNPHVWLSIGGAIRETKNIADGLAMADPSHAAAYVKNARGYSSRLGKLRREMHAGLDGLKNRDIITFHEAFPYFASEFNLQVAGVVEREPGSEPSAGELAKIIEMVRKTRVKALFAEPQYPLKTAEVIHRETGVPVRILDPAVTGPREAVKARDSYILAMEENLKVLQEALKE